jgi:hypothetical protein
MYRLVCPHCIDGNIVGRRSRHGGTLRKPVGRARR